MCCCALKCVKSKTVKGISSCRLVFRCCTVPYKIVKVQRKYVYSFSFFFGPLEFLTFFLTGGQRQRIAIARAILKVSDLRLSNIIFLTFT